MAVMAEKNAFLGVDIEFRVGFTVCGAKGAYIYGFLAYGFNCL